MNTIFTLRKAKTTSFKASAAEGELCMEMYDVIGADYFGDGITAQTISDCMANAGVYNKITCRINSPGGDLFEGVAIYNLLKSYGKPVNCIVDGMAASAASLIAMAGDKVTMGTGTLMMIHEAMAMHGWLRSGSSARWPTRSTLSPRLLPISTSRRRA